MRRLTVLVLLLAPAAAACSAPDAPEVRRVDAARGTDAAPPEPKAVDDEAGLSAAEVLATTRRSVVRVETSWATGTGLVVDGGYVLTNAHVVTPFDRADVDAEGTGRERDVPVVGVDFDADLALLGPLDAELPAIRTPAEVAVVGGEAVFLIGYPGADGEDAMVTISGGIVSRTREARGFDQSFIQTDADISGGQSGGALVDAAGRVVGISGMSLDEAFALVLSIDDALDRVPALVAGGQPWRARPHDGVRSGSVTIDPLMGVAAIDVLAGRAGEVTLHFEGRPEVVDAIGLQVWGAEHSYVSANVLATLADEYDMTIDELEAMYDPDEILRTTPDGTYRFDVIADDAPTVLVRAPGSAGAATVGFTSSRPVIVLDDRDDGAVIDVGETVAGVVEPLEGQDVYALELRAGDEVEIEVVSAIGDVAFDVVAPGARLDATSYRVDDSGGGLFGLDARGTYTADTDGVHHVVVSEFSGVGGYRLSIRGG